MDRLRKIGVIVAFLLLGPVLISLFAGFQTAIAQPVALIGGIALGAIMVAIFLKAALVPERRHTGWARAITSSNSRFLFAILLVGWVAAMAFLSTLGLGPNQLGAPALVGLFAGFFIFMGFIWSVIGE